ncbi:hypothetical protein VPH35_049515 [Triticum aestivum]
MEDAIDLDLDAAAGLASLASSGAVAPSGKGKPCAPRKTAAAAKPKKVLTPEQRARESAKRKGRRHAADARDEAAAQAAAVAAAQQEFTNAPVAAATREALYMLGVNHSQHGLVQAAVAAASTGSSAFPRMVMPDSPRASACNPVPGSHVYPQASRISGECSPRASACNPVTPSTPAPAPIDLNATPVVGGLSSGSTRKCARQAPAGGLPDDRNLFEEMSSAVDEDYMQHLIFEGGVPGTGYDLEETQSQDGRGAFTPAAGYDPDQAAFMRDQVGIDLDGFPLDHEFSDDYGLEEEDECDIEVEPLFEDELANQPPVLSRSARASTRRHFKLWRRHSRFNTMASASTSSIAIGSSRTKRSSRHNMPQYAALKARGGKGTMEDVGEGEPARPRGKTNSKKEDKRDAATNALIASVDDMMNKKDSREKERRRFKAEQMDAFMKI